MGAHVARVIARVDSIAPRLEWIPLLAARMTVGWVFLQSGWGKLHNLEGVASYFASLGIPAPQIQAPIVASVELVGGFLILLGFGTRVAALPLVGVMLVAIRTALWGEVEEWSDLFGLAEFGYIVLSSVLVVFGAGAISVDAWVRRRSTD